MIPLHHWQRSGRDRVNPMNIEMGVISIPQLYKLDEDPGEQNNLAEQFPERVEELHAIMMEITGQH